ncbi:MAG: hypothetical protein ACE361_19965 [Aureliella sp.]
MSNRLQIIAVVFAVLVIPNSADAQRRGGGRSFGGGGGRSFGGAAGGMSRMPSGGMSRPSGMTRPSVPSMPNRNFSRPSSLPTGGFGGNNYSRNSLPKPPAMNNQLAGTRPQTRLPSTGQQGRLPNTGQSRLPNAGSNRGSNNLQNRLPSTNNPANLPNRGSFNTPGGSAANAAANQFEKPSNNQLNDFLGMSNRNPTPGTADNSRGNKSFEGDNFSVDTFGGKGSGSKGDVDYGGAYGGAVITDADGNKRVVGRGVGGATNGDGTVAGTGKVAAGSNADGGKGIDRSGTVVGKNDNGVAVGSGNSSIRTDGNGNFSAERNRAGVATNGDVAVGGASSINASGKSDGSRDINARGARGATDGENAIVQRGAASATRDRYGNVRGGAAGSTFATDGRNVYREGAAVRAVRDPFGNMVARGAYGATYNGFVRDARQVVAVRRGFRGYTYYFRPNWYRRYPGAWYVSGIAVAAWWYAPSYSYVSGYCGYPNTPVSYDYGPDAVYVQNGDVYYGGEYVSSQDEYYQDASGLAGEEPEDLAETNAAAEGDDSEEWLPLGVFAVVEEGETSSDVTLQLAVNKAGDVRGNVIIESKDEVRPVYGNVDKETQKVAFKVDGRQEIVVEAGLYNLTEDVLTVMVHFSNDRSEARGLVRLTEEEEEGSQP